MFQGQNDGKMPISVLILRVNYRFGQTFFFGSKTFFFAKKKSAREKKSTLRMNIDYILSDSLYIEALRLSNSQAIVVGLIFTV